MLGVFTAVSNTARSEGSGGTRKQRVKYSRHGGRREERGRKHCNGRLQFDEFCSPRQAFRKSRRNSSSARRLSPILPHPSASLRRFTWGAGKLSAGGHRSAGARPNFVLPFHATTTTNRTADSRAIPAISAMATSLSSPENRAEQQLWAAQDVWTIYKQHGGVSSASVSGVRDSIKPTAFKIFETVFVCYNVKQLQQIHDALARANPEQPLTLSIPHHPNIAPLPFNAALVRPCVCACLWMY